MPIDIGKILAEGERDRFELFKQRVSPQWARVLRTIGFDKNWVRGEGAYLWDDKGDKYLDFMSGWGVFNFGRKHPDIVRAVDQVLHSELPGWIAFDTPALAAVLADELCRRMPNDLERVYFCNSGTEAVEAAIKFSRKATGKHHIIHLRKSFHGLTTGSLSLNGDESFRQGFEPFLPTSLEAPANDLEALEALFETHDVAAFIAEPILGKGVVILEDDYLWGARELCRKHGALLVMDEVQTGMGRSVKFLASAWVEGLDPDVVLLSKALSGGLVPVGALITRKEIHDAVYPSMEKALTHACTFGMGNLAMAAGLASLQVLDAENLIARANDLGAQFKAGLEAQRERFEFISEIRQRGLMIGIAFDKPRSMGLRTAWAMIHKMDENLFPQAVVIPLFDDGKVLTQVAGHAIDVVKLLPPLTISDEDVQWFLKSFEDVMVSLHKFPGPVWEVLKKLGKHAVKGRGRKSAGQEA